MCWSRAAGKFKNTKGRHWGSIGVMVNDYMSPHEDMQTIITEYVSNKPDVTADGGACYMNVALAVEQAVSPIARFIVFSLCLLC